MSYTSTSKFPSIVKKADIIKLLELLNYKKNVSYTSKETGRVDTYYWFDDTDYRSWSGVEVSFYKKNDILCVDTRTTNFKSYYDLTQQNETIRVLKKFLGGSFESDEGKNRYSHPYSGPQKPSQSGCHLAFLRFGKNIKSASIYYHLKEFPDFPKETTGVFIIDTTNPILVSNNLLLPFLVAILEDYFKSTYIALLRYSEKKGAVLKKGSNKINNEEFTQISKGDKLIEEAVAEHGSFQNINEICKNFQGLGIDFGAALKKPYHKRKISLFESLEDLVSRRHNLIHRGVIDTTLSDKITAKMIADLRAAIVRCYKHLTKVKGWEYENGGKNYNTPQTFPTLFFFG